MLIVFVIFCRIYTQRECKGTQCVVTKHLKNICDSGELDEERTCANFAQVADNGKAYRSTFYSQNQRRVK